MYRGRPDRKGRTKGKGCEVRAWPSLERGRPATGGKGGAAAKPRARYPICVGTLRICSDVPRPKRGCEMKLLVKEWGWGVVSRGWVKNVLHQDHPRPHPEPYLGYGE